MFYTSLNQHALAEELFRKVLTKLEEDKSSESISFNVVMALNFYGRLLVGNPKREREAGEYLKQSELMAMRIPFWYDKIDSIYLPEFNLD